MSTEPERPRDYRRTMVLVISIVLLVTFAVVSWRFGNQGSAKFVAAATGRIGLVMAALWLAWPSLRRPASWLPPGFAVIGVVALAVLAAQPRLIVVAIPALGTLLALATVVRSIKRQ
ncbi:MAG: hypothetical protein ACR2NZ_25700 [Rubripirellula sp.]